MSSFQDAADGDATLGKSQFCLLECCLHEWIHGLKYAVGRPLRGLILSIGTEIAYIIAPPTH